jgi:hypothetical protein
MINNESLFDLYVGRRHRGYRNAFSAPRWASIPVPMVQSVTDVYIASHGLREPVETITETDMHDDSVYATCDECGVHDYAAMFHTDGLCAHCELANWQDWQDTMAAINREEYARA